MSMRKRNYCFDQRPFNQLPREFIETTDEKGKKTTTSYAKDGRNRKLKCAIGFTVTVASKQALQNAEKNGAKVCSALRKVLS